MVKYIYDEKIETNDSYYCLMNGINKIDRVYDEVYRIEFDKDGEPFYTVKNYGMS